MASQNNLTRGSLSGNLIAFAVPFLLANLLQALYGAVDLLVVGKFGGGSVGVAAIAAGGEVMHLIMSFIMGLTTGATVLIGRFFGARDRVNVNRSIGMTLSFSALTGIGASAVILPLIPLLARTLQTPPESFEATVRYMTICGWGIFFIVGYNALAAIFRGFGNSRAPLVFVGIACAINVAGDLLFVAVLKTGVAGAALATVLSQALSMILALRYLKKGHFGFPFHKGNFTLSCTLVREYLKIGVPIATQSILINVSFLFIFSIVNAMGVAAAAGYGIVNRINTFAMLPAMAFSMAIAAVTAQNIGAGKPMRAVRTLRLAILYTFAAGAIFLILLQVFPEQSIGLFIDASGSGAADTIRQGALYVRSFSWEYILVPIVFCTNGFFNGCGRSFFSMLNNLTCTFLVRVPASYFFSQLPGATLFAVGLAAPLASFSSNVAALIYLYRGRWRDTRKTNKP